MKRGLALFSVSIILILSISLVSASWFSDFWNGVQEKIDARYTGKAVEKSYTSIDKPVVSTGWGSSVPVCSDSASMNQFCMIKGYDGGEIGASYSGGQCAQYRSSDGTWLSSSSTLYSARCYKNVEPTSNQTNVTSSCTDSDGGKNYYVKGTTSLSNIATTDVCYSDSTLNEYSCNQSAIQNEYYNCPDSCFDGACVNSSNSGNGSITGIYPSPFIHNNIADVAIVYGTNPGISQLELVAAGNIQTGLEGYSSSPLGNLLVEDSEIDRVSSKNLIVVGSICADTNSNKLISIYRTGGTSGDNSCENSRNNLGIKEGQFLIETTESPFPEGKIILWVIGDRPADVIAAEEYLRNKENSIGTFVGFRVIGTPIGAFTSDSFLIQKNIEEWTYIGPYSGSGWFGNAYYKWYGATYKKSESNVNNLDVYEFASSEDAISATEYLKSLYGYGFTNDKIGNNNVLKIFNGYVTLLVWRNNNLVISIPFSDEFGLPVSLVNAYLDKYPSDLIGDEGSSNTPPKIISFNGWTVLEPNQARTFTWEAQDVDRDNLLWTIDWGEGSSIAQTPQICKENERCGRKYSENHTWLVSGPYRIKATVTDNRGGVDDDVKYIAIGNPSADSFLLQQNIEEWKFLWSNSVPVGAIEDFPAFTTHAAVYFKDESLAYTGAWDFYSKENASRFMESIKSKFVYTNTQIGGHNVLIIPGIAIVWASGNAVISINELSALASNIDDPTIKSTQIKTNIIQTAKNLKSSDVSKKTTASSEGNVSQFPMPLIKAYLDKYPSDIANSAKTGINEKGLLQKLQEWIRNIFG